MNTFLKQRIQDREARVARLSRQIHELQRERRDVSAELRAYLDVLANAPNAESQSPHKPTSEDDIEAVSPKSSRMSDTWRSILASLYDLYPLSTSVEDIKGIVRDLNRDMSDESLRSQLSVYTSKGWLERPSTGHYRITESGAQMINRNLQISTEEMSDFNPDAADSESDKSWKDAFGNS